jgi:exodeoxyribonuclease VII small subunit
MSKQTEKETLNYETAYEELRLITQSIENETISVDELSTKVKRAAVLIQFCQDRLRSTELEVNKIIKQMEARDLPE